MWALMAFCSAFMLGLYDVSKKKALSGNAVIPVLFCNTLISLAIYIPFVAASYGGFISGDSIFYAATEGFQAHLYIIVKSFLVLTSWIFGYFGIKHLPITIVGPINAMRPVLVLLGAMLIFSERLNAWQWAGVGLAFISFLLLSRAGKKEGVDFRRDKWIVCIIVSSLFSAASGLYDKFLMGMFPVMFVQAWFNIYQFLIMGVVLMVLWYPKRASTTPFKWRNSIILIPVILALADFVYFYALSFEDSMISIVSMIRRSSVIVSFTVGAFIFREKNIRSKAIDLVLILIGMTLLYIGSR